MDVSLRSHLKKRAPWLNWIEHLTTDQKVAGSSPAGVTQLYYRGKRKDTTRHVESMSIIWKAPCIGQFRIALQPQNASPLFAEHPNQAFLHAGNRRVDYAEDLYFRSAHHQ